MKPEDVIFREWRKYATLSNKSLGDIDAESIANRAICDQLQYLLQDWSPYGHTLVFNTPRRY